MMNYNELVAMLMALADNDGKTFKAGKPVVYKSGWQVATEGVECRTPEEAMKAIKKYNGNCGVWLENGIYYIDTGKAVADANDSLPEDATIDGIHLKQPYCEKWLNYLKTHI